MMSNNQAAKQSFKINKRRSVEELKMKNESTPVCETTKMPAKPKSPKKSKKSKVKQVASMFNSMITQIIRRDNVAVGKYVALINEFSPEPKPLPRTTLVNPVPMPRTRFTNPRAPVPSPRTKSLMKMATKASACFVAEDVFGKLSVKEKAQLYTQFVEEMSKKNPLFGKHAKAIEVSNETNVVCGEVIAEKQASVKDLLAELEFNTVFPKTARTEAKALQRIDSMKRALAARQNIKASHNNATKAKEFEGTLDSKKNIHQEKAKSLPRLQPSTTIQFQINEPTQTNTTIFQNQQMEDLFLSWFKEKHENDDVVESIANQSDIDEEKQKSHIDRLFEEAIAEFETIEAKQNAKVSKSAKSNATSSTASSSAKTSETEESESGLSSLPKNTSEDSQPESQQTKAKNSGNDSEFAKPLKPLRKKKLRRNVAWKKDVSQKETKQTTTTDSESDSKQAESKLKRLTAQPVSQEVTVAKQTLHEADEAIEEIDESLMKLVNSPRKIKSAYTLTVLDTPLCTPRTSLNFAKQQPIQKGSGDVAPAVCLGDSFTDQGFETATNDADSPLKKMAIPSLAEMANSPLPSTKNNFSFFTPIISQERHSLAASTSVKQQLFSPISKPLKSPPLSSTKNNFVFSTPIISQERHSFAASTSAKQQLFSPISKPLKNRRKSLYDVESKRNSLAMQVIKEGQPLESPEAYSKLYNQTAQKIITNAPSKEMSKKSSKLSNEKTSQFWIKCGDFSVTLEINYNSAERVRSLYEIFSQTSCDTKDLHFGIDDNKFSVHGPLDMINTSKRIPSSKRCSHYWFSSGELAIPFSGKYLPSHKIQRLFHAIKETVEETGILRFGVDEVEFSNIPEFWHQQPKFSVESQYSMLVGLQSGDSNGLEGRNKYAWPHSKSMMISNDWDQSNNEDDIFDEIECGRSSFAPFSRNFCDLASLGNEELAMPRKSLAMMSLESYCGEYENEPLDQLFDDSFNLEHKKQWEETKNMSVPKIFHTMQNEKQRLSNVQEQLAFYVKPSYMDKDTLDALKGTPEYVEKLKSIVSDISNIGCSNNFKQSSLEELESYMQLLSRYAEICLNSCNKHMDTVLDALVDYKAVVV